MDRWMRVLLFGAGVAMLMLATDRLRLSSVRFLRPVPSDQEKDPRSTKEANMTHASVLPQSNRRSFTGLFARIRAVASMMAAEQTLALHAAHRAALSRRKLEALRAMYVRPLDR